MMNTRLALVCSPRLTSYRYRSRREKPPPENGVSALKSGCSGPITPTRARSSLRRINSGQTVKCLKSGISGESQMFLSARRVRLVAKGPFSPNLPSVLMPTHQSVCSLQYSLLSGLSVRGSTSGCARAAAGRTAEKSKANTFDTILPFIVCSARQNMTSWAACVTRATFWRQFPRFSGNPGIKN
ncbi:hypothetical protein D3C72_1800660 [compost metagenome]